MSMSNTCNAIYKGLIRLRLFTHFGAELQSEEVWGHEGAIPGDYTSFGYPWFHEG